MTLIISYLLIAFKCTRISIYKCCHLDSSANPKDAFKGKCLNQKDTKTSATAIVVILLEQNYIYIRV